MTIKQMNSYIVRRMRAEAELSMLYAQSEKWIEKTFDAVTNNRKFDTKENEKLMSLAIRTNKLDTDINFFNQQLSSCDTIANEKFKLN